MHLSSPYQALVPGMTMSIPPEVFYIGMKAQLISAGDCCVVIAGVVTKATANSANRVGVAPFVPIQTIDNSGGTDGSKTIGGVGGGQRITVTTDATLHPFDYVKIGTTDGHVTQFVAGTDNVNLVYGKYITKESAVFSRGASPPYQETLSAGMVPLINAAASDVVIIELAQDI